MAAGRAARTHVPDEPILIRTFCRAELHTQNQILDDCMKNLGLSSKS